jgi:hypothetical protein
MPSDFYCAPFSGFFISLMSPHRDGQIWSKYLGRQNNPPRPAFPELKCNIGILSDTILLIFVRRRPNCPQIEYSRPRRRGLLHCFGVFHADVSSLAYHCALLPIENRGLGTSPSLRILDKTYSQLQGAGSRSTSHLAGNARKLFKNLQANDGVYT